MSSNLLLYLSFGSFLVSWLTVALIKRRFSAQLLDIPNDRSSHTVPTPRGGGLGFVIAFAFTSALALWLLSPSLPLIPLWLTLIPLAAIGIIDDRQGVPASLRYLVQFAVSGIAVFSLGAFPQPWLLEFGIFGQILAIAFTVIGMTAIINLYNFMDGLDGLVAGCSVVQIGFFAVYFQQPILWLLVAALIGFLLWNWSPAKIFMGDVGSTSLGAIVAFVLLANDQNSGAAWSALVITLPLLGDAIYTLFCRLLRRENIFQAHRSHLYQRLQKSGWSHRLVASVYIGLTFLIATGLYFFGAAAAWLGLILTLVAILAGEIYLKLKAKN
jgi:Fuc2NAc and GlcNAc transferase